MIISIVWVRFPDKTPRNRKSHLRKLPIWATKRKLYLIPEWQWLKRDSHEGLQTFLVEGSFAFNSYIKPQQLGELWPPTTSCFRCFPVSKVHLFSVASGILSTRLSPLDLVLANFNWLQFACEKKKKTSFCFQTNGWVQKHVWIKSA